MTLAATISAVFNGLTSHAQKLGVFDRVGQHEPENAPHNGVSCAIWLDGIRSDTKYSGLASISTVVTFTVRCYQSLMVNPSALDSIDPNLLGAVCVLLNEYSGAFTLGGAVRDIDLTALSARAAYVEHDGQMLRVIDITVPAGLNDQFTEVA